MRVHFLFLIAIPAGVLNVPAMRIKELRMLDGTQGLSIRGKKLH